MAALPTGLPILILYAASLFSLVLLAIERTYWPSLTLVAISLPCLTLLAFMSWSESSLLSRVPGPSIAQFSSLWMVMHSLRGTQHHAILRLHEKHGNRPVLFSSQGRLNER